jgi:hypothetical protein
MLRLFTVAGFALAVATSAQGISPAPLSSAIRHNQPSSLGMRPRSDASCGCLRGKNQHPAYPPSRPQGLPQGLLRATG